MNLLAIKACAALALLAGLVAGYLGWHHHVFKDGVAYEKAAWDADTAARQKAEAVAVAKRNAENTAAADLNRENNRLITRTYDEQIATLRARLDAAPRMRIGPAICGGPARPAAAGGAGGGDVSDSGARLLPDQTENDIRALMLEVETALAAARAAQAFIRENGMAPP